MSTIKRSTIIIFISLVSVGALAFYIWQRASNDTASTTANSATTATAETPVIPSAKTITINARDIHSDAISGQGWKLTDRASWYYVVYPATSAALEQQARSRLSGTEDVLKVVTTAVAGQPAVEIESKGDLTTISTWTLRGRFLYGFIGSNAEQEEDVNAYRATLRNVTFSAS